MVNDGARVKARVHFANFQNDDTGEITPLYLYSHEDIDTEIDRRNRAAFARDHEGTRRKFHATLARAIRAKPPASRSSRRPRPKRPLATTEQFG
jgi:hypothetical protein